MNVAPALFCALLAASVWNANAAARADVLFPTPEAYRDVGYYAYRRDDNLRRLGDIVQALAEKSLADGQTLTVVFDQIDLAGRERLRPGAPDDLRIMTGTDWPRLQLRWVLQTPGAADRSGAANLVDMAYLGRLSTVRTGGPLADERRMLADWFDATFGAAAVP